MDLDDNPSLVRIIRDTLSEFRQLMALQWWTEYLKKLGEENGVPNLRRAQFTSLIGGHELYILRPELATPKMMDEPFAVIPEGMRSWFPYQLPEELTMEFAEL